jgi:ACR3 family arsenite efflux pump ArsB
MGNAYSHITAFDRIIYGYLSSGRRLVTVMIVSTGLTIQIVLFYPVPIHGLGHYGDRKMKRGAMQLRDKVCTLR